VKVQPENSLYHNELGVILDDLGEFDEAQAHYDAALEINMKNDDPSEVAVSLSNKGGSLLKQGKYKDAIILFTLALPLAEKDFDQNAELIASLHGNLAGAYLETGELDKVRKTLETAVAVGAVYKSPNQYEKMGSYINTAGLMHFQKNELKEALKCFKNALGFMESKGKNHPNTAVINNNIGNVNLSLGHYRKAMEYFKKSLQIARDVFDDYHPTIVPHYFSIGKCLGKMGNLEEALEYFKNALDICETIYTTAHPDTALAYHNIGATLSESGNDEEGMEYLEKSLAMNKLIYGENHPSLAENYMDMGSIMVDRENYQQALSYFEKTFDISNTMLGPDHADTVQAKQLIALCRKRLNGG
jgi:tetratricopeptide (TPR) repeat protein